MLFVFQSVKSEEHWRIGEQFRPDIGMKQDIAALELVEVRKLHELVRRLEIQNESLTERRRNINTKNQALSGVLISCPSSPEENLNCCDLPDPEPAEVNGGDGISPPPLESPRDTLVRQDGHVYDGCYTHLPHSDMLEETHRQGCIGSEELVVRDTEKRAEHSSLELVDILDLEECCEVENEVSWLYESPKKGASAERSDESPIKWCRQVLDNPSPETEVACRTLINILDQKTRWSSIFSSRYHRRPVAFPDTGHRCMGSPSPRYQRSTDRSQQTNKPNSSDGNDAILPPSMDENEPSFSDDSITMGYRLQDLTDVQIMARMQEESLRQDYASIPAAPTPFRGPGASMLSPSNYSYSDLEFDKYSLEDRVAYTPPPSQLPHYRRSPLGQSPRAIAQPGYSSQLPRPPSQATTQSKLFKIAKSREGLRSSMSNQDSPPRTSLRSLQAVRNSRNLEANGQLLTDHPTSRLTYPVAGSTRSPPGESSVRLRSGGRSSSVSAKTLNSSDPPATGAARQSLRESFQALSIREPPRAQSLIPSGLRIPCPSKDFSVGGYLSSHVYASPERSTTMAWGRLGQPANNHR
ncbi:SLAIN motif-containing protein-like [Oncorhynchus nerka]|uniref:SLAIN motif-containing protein-like n=1 Tax=Oncorhynchus nerka TaxID=8023 RepID=UPI0031B84067